MEYRGQLGRSTILRVNKKREEKKARKLFLKVKYIRVRPKIKAKRVHEE
jgi:hypothetical protein